MNQNVSNSETFNCHMMKVETAALVALYNLPVPDDLRSFSGPKNNFKVQNVLQVVMCFQTALPSPEANN